MSFDNTSTSFDLSGSGITSLRGFDELQKMRRPAKLDLSRNPLRSLEHVTSSSSLQSLVLDGTEIANFSGVKPQPLLRELSMKNTPVACTPLYRVACLLAFGPKLRSIDGVSVTAAEVDAAFGFGADAAVAVSFGWVPPNTVSRSSEDYARIVRQLHADKRALQKKAIAGNEVTVTLQHTAEKLNLYNRNNQSPQRGAGGSGASDKDTAALQAKIVELEQMVAQLRKEKDDLQKQQEEPKSLASASTTPGAGSAASFDRKLTIEYGADGEEPAVVESAAATKEQQQAPSAVKFHPMKVPGVTVSELDTVDTLTWAAPATTVYAFVTGSAAALSMSAAPELTAAAVVGRSSSDLSASLPQSVSVSITRHTVEIQRLMSRQAMFRHPLSLLLRVEAGEASSSAAGVGHHGSTVGGSSSSSGAWARGNIKQQQQNQQQHQASTGPFSTVASLHLHFSDGCSALLLFTSTSAMNAVFKALKYRCVNGSRTISFSLDANLDSLQEFIAPQRQQEEFVDLFSKSNNFSASVSAGSPMASFSLAASTSFASGIGTVGGSAGGVGAGRAGSAASGGGGSVPVSPNVGLPPPGPSTNVPPIKNLADATAAVVAAGGGGGCTSSNPPSQSADRIVAVRPQTPASVSGRRDNVVPTKKRLQDITAGKNPDDDFELDSDEDTDDDDDADSKAASAGDAASGDEAAKPAALRGGMRGPGGQAVVIPTKIGVRSSTPQAAASSTTPTTPGAAGGGRSITPGSLSASASVSGSPGSAASQPVVVGRGFKGRALVVGAGGDSSSDDSSDDE